MAEVLTTIGWLALGVAIGWWFRRRAEVRELAQATTDILAAQWADHLEAHARSMDGTVALVAPPAKISAEEFGRAQREWEQRYGP